MHNGETLIMLKMTPREFVRAHAYLVMAFVSTVSVSVIAISLLPVAKWARTQNECVERTFRIDGKNNAGIPAKVWSCNGGGE